MHILSAQSGGSDDASAAIDLAQSPADIVFLSAADSELNLLDRTYRRLVGEGVVLPSLRLANLLHLRHNYSLDLYVDKTLSSAKLVIVRLLGGVGYWRYGVEEIANLHARHNSICAFLAGDENEDPQLLEFCRAIDKDEAIILWQYLVHGGESNASCFLQKAASLIGYVPTRKILPPQILAKAGLYKRGKSNPNFSDFTQNPSKPQRRVAILFYRAYLQAADLEPIEALVQALQKLNLQAIPVYTAGLKDKQAANIIADIFQQLPPHLVLNSLGFSLAGSDAKIDCDNDISPYLPEGMTAPVMQIILSSQSRKHWHKKNNGLNIRDIAMYVALTEIDGNILSRAISFKTTLPYSKHTQIAPAVHKCEKSRVQFVAQLAKNTIKLQTTPNHQKRIALIMANYPAKDGRLANGVGLDTPASAVACLQALADNHYNVEGLDNVNSADKLMHQLSQLPTNAIASANNHSTQLNQRQIKHSLSLNDYHRLFAQLPPKTQTQITQQWGDPSQDPFFIKDANILALPFFTCGNIAIGIQPARGYHIDPKTTYHDPHLVPPHAYCAAYLWLNHIFGTNAIVHLGKHGNLEWLPGKALALSAQCCPEAMLGAIPHVYPFIVNDPGEGCQAKRRTAAIIIDHLTPPMVRAENYGILSELESLCDEYYEALLMDKRRTAYLRKEILNFATLHKLDKDLGEKLDLDSNNEDDMITALDGFLCELKESQIRSGLHVLMHPPAADTYAEFAVSLLYYPRPSGRVGEQVGEFAGNQSILVALCEDLGISDFDPLDCDFAAVYSGAKPPILQAILDSAWRICGDTVTRLQLLAQAILNATTAPPGPASLAVLDYWQNDLQPRLALSPMREKRAFLAALNGAHVAPGSSGAPTRARPDVLPTGRNFYSVDVRAVPTPAAWKLGWASAQMLAERHAQQHGHDLRQTVINVWGTSNMRTGGDDIAQALALIGARPTWDTAAKRVTGFEILPLAVLGRPRIDVSLRISGFFRDAFASLVELFDSASRAIQKLEESPEENPLAAHYRESLIALRSEGCDSKQASLASGRRIFGSPSGAYGAGLQALIDEGIWQDKSDIAMAYLQWGSYAYGVNDYGSEDKVGFSRILKRTQAVIHNQDNREHDILDSDDYYQFEGGVSAAIEHLSGSPVPIYHNDHSNPVVPKIRTLQEEIGRVVRSRAANPKWIESVRRHGYKGAFEIAATVDYLFAFAATTGLVQNHHFDLLFSAYAGDSETADFIRAHNPEAWREICSRFREAVERDLWKPARNDWAEIIGGV